MNRFPYWLALAAALLCGDATRADELPAASPKGTELAPTAKAHASYGIGLQVGRSLQSSGFDAQLFDADQFVKGVLDSLAGKESALTDKQLEAAMMALDSAVNARRSQAGDKNKTDGEAFLAANAKKPGVKVLPSGLQYKVIKAGNGATPKKTDQVTTHYEGRLINGKVFDSSIARGEPATFPVGGVIKGWVEALQLMKVGDKWQLYIPSELAYGERGAGSDIGPNSVLIFDIELLDIPK